MQCSAVPCRAVQCSAVPCRYSTESYGITFTVASHAIMKNPPTQTGCRVSRVSVIFLPSVVLVVFWICCCHRSEAIKSTIGPHRLPAHFHQHFYRQQRTNDRSITAGTSAIGALVQKIRGGSTDPQYDPYLPPDQEILQDRIEEWKRQQRVRTT